MIDLLELLGGVSPPVDDPGGDVSGDPPAVRAWGWGWPDLFWWIR